MPLHVSSTCAHHQEVKIALHGLWYHHTSCTGWERTGPVLSQPVRETATYTCDDTRDCVMQFWPLDDELMCSKHVEAWNKLIVKRKFCASSWLITEINILSCTVSKTSKSVILYLFRCITKTIQVTEGRKYFPRGSHVGSPDLGKSSKEGRVRIILQYIKVWVPKKGNVLKITYENVVDVTKHDKTHWLYIRDMCILYIYNLQVKRHTTVFFPYVSETIHITLTMTFSKTTKENLWINIYFGVLNAELN